MLLLICFCVVAGLSFALRDDCKSMSFSSVVIGSLGDCCGDCCSIKAITDF